MFKRTGWAKTGLRLCLYENEPVVRFSYEVHSLTIHPRFDCHFLYPNTEKVRQSLLSVVDNGVDMLHSPLFQILHLLLDSRYYTSGTLD